VFLVWNILTSVDLESGMPEVRGHLPGKA
jgi:hypothetical protein